MISKIMYRFVVLWRILDVMHGLGTHRKRRNAPRSAAFGTFDNSLPKGNLFLMRQENAPRFLTPGTLLEGD